MAGACGSSRSRTRVRRSTSPGRNLREATLEKSLNILLIEDDQVDVMNVRRAFDKNRIANPLYVACDGVDALEKLRSGAVPTERRLILLDLNMPRMNGIEFLRELRADPL